MVVYSSLDYGIALSVLCICLTNLLFTLLDGHTGKIQNKLYITILVLIGINAVCELVNVRTSDASVASDSVFLASRLSKFFYFFTHNLVPPVLYYYLSFVIGRFVVTDTPGKPQGIRKYSFVGRSPVILAVITELMILTNPLTNWCWYYSEDRMFHRSWGEYIFIYGFSAVWVIHAFIMFMKSWSILSRGRKRSIAICFMLACSGIVIQLIFKQYRVEILLEALGLTGVLMFIENEDDRRNVELDAYNSAAFTLDVRAAVSNHIPLKVLIIRSIDFDRNSNSVVSVKIDRDAACRMVSDYLASVVDKYCIYAVGNRRFAVTLYNTSKNEAAEIEEKICSRFRSAWRLDSVNLHLSAKFLLIDVPELAANAEEVLYFAECMLPKDIGSGIVDEKSLERIIRRAAVEKAVTHGLDENAFEVYYQATYNIDRSLHGAEALLRMNDRNMGMIYPDEFIPVAEQLGIIDNLDEFVLKEVCRFIDTGIPQKNGMECINVNLSVLECVKDGFAENIKNIVDSIGIRRDMINFEITESVAAEDYDHLSDVIEQLKSQGFQFSIDDYGTGFSNITSMFSLGADIIKIDKSILWNSSKSEEGMELLKVSVDMVHKMKKKALCEGVETEEQINLLSELGCDYLQGYYFSKPLSEKDFIDLIENKDK
ncbi:EAL domain-containing protein [Ruminococcus sp. HUN007]|uniref:EAL domain-containing protein n=1 Tax=Ruminococcus sp. HUN007 TaxID=1514668 RepID=UPI0005D233A4|nr:EAL domain-containing protein [Ruminococcus sp. HUN007]